MELRKKGMLKAGNYHFPYNNGKNITTQVYFKPSKWRLNSINDSFRKTNSIVEFRRGNDVVALVSINSSKNVETVTHPAVSSVYKNLREISSENVNYLNRHRLLKTYYERLNKKSQLILSLLGNVKDEKFASAAVDILRQIHK